MLVLLPDVSPIAWCKSHTLMLVTTPPNILCHSYTLSAAVVPRPHGTWKMLVTHDASSSDTETSTQWRLAKYATSDSRKTQMTIKSNEQKQFLSSFQIKSLLNNHFCAWITNYHLFTISKVVGVCHQGKQGPKVVKERLRTINKGQCYL